MQTTIPTHALNCMCDMCEDDYTPPVLDARSSKRATHVNICPVVSPLARAALENGVTFEDVQAYLNWPQSRSLDVHLYEQALTDSPDLAELFCGSDNRLDAALARSFLAQTDGSIAAARIWWHGVLP